MTDYLEDFASTAGPAALPPLGLTWGLKRSFISYLSRLPDRAVSATRGASVIESSLFNFSPDGGTFDPQTGLGTMRFRGDVRLSGHYGMMFVHIADPWIEFAADHATFSIAKTQGLGSENPRLPLAMLDVAAPTPAGGSYVWDGLPIALAPEGTSIFDDQYPAGQPMDPLFIRYPDPARG
ncbi:HtaA domain-containing protein [Arthrobacter sp. I2-34]|uniref:HtaA domain-containing protein n=1 Tax=Arthrobacter hankyongi TaxID=2904801 RepID=A0ABS9L3P5_9MICC|nr:HtaA domain-containing protein [Arthrobacter hankyongi]MCG2621278.1 HtaA domain-containing protein [Arthrobacter hankyongi]